PNTTRLIRNQGPLRAMKARAAPAIVAGILPKRAEWPYISLSITPTPGASKAFRRPPMSRAFVKDGEDAFDEPPDRPISPHPNLVTPEGLAAIEATLARLHEEYAAAQRSHARAALALAARDLRYWTARRASAQVVAAPADSAKVHFGL